MAASDELSAQWRNPRDILSLLLLVGGDIVQKAIAQLFGVYVEPARGWPRIYLTPVAFSFGWVGYAITSLGSIIGDKQLMPSIPDSHSIVINCDNGYTRINRSWLLGRIIRDHELAVAASPGPEAAKLNDPRNRKAAGLAENDPPHRVSLRIDIFELEEEEANLVIDHVWVLGWLTIAAQLGISIIPWVLYGDWAVFLVAAAGTLLALVTASLRQWNLEKWPGRRLNPPRKLAKGMNDESKASPPPVAVGLVPANSGSTSDMEEGRAGRSAASEVPPATSPPQQRRLEPRPAPPEKRPKTKIVCLTRGNGHRHIQILLGSGSAWDLEALATATTDSLPETPWCLASLAVLWVGLLISVSGLGSHTWFLLLIGGLGMLQNIYAASAARKPESLGLGMKPFAERPTIIGLAVDKKNLWSKPGTIELSDDEGVTPDDPLVREKPYLEPWETVGVRGAIRELEKTIPKAGMALTPEFFPALWKVDRERYRDKREARFWRWMYKRPRKEDRKTASSCSPSTNHKVP
ncbi:hypothetical protein F4824DRAFT_219382 [Ustulina deusta]|nr:hypothetical protein F4824DRAFT_219382 [Ustulina deusta]